MLNLLPWLLGLELAAAPAPPARVRLAGTAPDSAAILATVESFHAALATGDTAAALALLAPDAVILESGELEDRAQYAAHHLSADIEFTRAVRSTRVVTRVVQDGTAGWVAAVTTARGTFRERPVDTQGAELMVLTHTARGWRIRAIHWSSRRRP